MLPNMLPSPLQPWCFRVLEGWESKLSNWFHSLSLAAPFPQCRLLERVPYWYGTWLGFRNNNYTQFPRRQDTSRICSKQPETTRTPNHINATFSHTMTTTISTSWYVQQKINSSTVVSTYFHPLKRWGPMLSFRGGSSARHVWWYLL